MINYKYEKNLAYFKNGLIHHVKKLFPICRSITGKGIRQTLSYFESYNKEFKRLSFKTGEKVFDWNIPKEWNIVDGFIEHIESRKKFAEFKKLNLHIVGYSEPIDKILNLEKFIDRIHVSKSNDNFVPYVTSYYKKYWGFCLSKKEKEALPKGKYRVFINSSLTNGSLEMSHALIKGKRKEEILFSSYVCHPSMANNELSGPIVLNALLNYIKSKYKKSKYSYRFLMLPETIGSLAYLSKNINEMKKNTVCGFNLSCVGDERAYSYVNSPFKNTLADKAIKSSLIGKENVKIYSFLERGSDERQYCAPGVRLPLITFCRSKFGEYPEYHTSEDNLNLVTDQGLYDSYEVMKSIIDAFEFGLYPKVKTKGEPQLGKRGLYPQISEVSDKHPAKQRMNIISYADGETSLFDIAAITNTSLKEVIKEFEIISAAGLI